MKPASARDQVLEDPACAGVPVLERLWYYKMELEPGLWTRGRMFENVHLTREALRRIDVEGLDCLDIGAMEGLVSVLLHRRGAASVVAYDRLDFSERVALVNDKLGAGIDYLYGFPLTDLGERLEGRSLYDLVVFSGVLYHMFDVLGGLLRARRHLRDGGIMLVETAAVLAPEPVLHFNAKGRFMSGDNFWFPTFGLLDYLLRFCRLQALDVLHFDLPPIDPAAGALARVCVPCVAVSGPIAEPDDVWISRKQKKDFIEHLDWSELQAAARRPIPYDVTGRPLVRRTDGSLDVYATALKSPNMHCADREREVALPLGSLY